MTPLSPAPETKDPSTVMNPVSGRKIDVASFSQKDVCLLDIAHALSLQCRAGGHFLRFYSVAQHCLNCEAEAAARGLPSRLRLACLLHDAGEAYLSDLIRPVKALLPDYMALERKIDAAVFAAFSLDGLSAGDWAAVREIDDAMLYHEFRLLRGDVVIRTPAPPLCLVPDVAARDAAAVREEFAARCRALCEQENILFSEE